MPTGAQAEEAKGTVEADPPAFVRGQVQNARRAVVQRASDRREACHHVTRWRRGTHRDARSRPQARCDIATLACVYASYMCTLGVGAEQERALLGAVMRATWRWCGMRCCCGSRGTHAADDLQATAAALASADVQALLRRDWGIGRGVARAAGGRRSGAAMEAGCGAGGGRVEMRSLGGGGVRGKSTLTGLAAAAAAVAAVPEVGGLVTSDDAVAEAAELEAELDIADPAVATEGSAATDAMLAPPL